MRIMYKKMTSVLFALILLSLLFVGVNAMEESSFSLPVTLSIEGPLPEMAEEYIIRLTALDNNTPMPNGTSGGIYDLAFTEEGTKSFPVISFATVGIYQYTIEQLPGSNPNGTYDERCYRIKVYVTNNTAGGYDVTVILSEDGVDTKPDQVLFRNVYTPEVTPTPPPPIPPTGVEDRWPLYLGGGVLLLAAALVIALRLLKKEQA